MIIKTWTPEQELKHKLPEYRSKHSSYSVFVSVWILEVMVHPGWGERIEILRGLVLTRGDKRTDVANHMT